MELILALNDSTEPFYLESVQVKGSGWFRMAYTEPAPLEARSFAERVNGERWKWSHKSSSERWKEPRIAFMNDAV